VRNKRIALDRGHATRRRFCRGFALQSNVRVNNSQANNCVVGFVNFYFLPRLGIYKRAAAALRRLGGASQTVTRHERKITGAGRCVSGLPRRTKAGEVHARDCIARIRCAFANGGEMNSFLHGGGRERSVLFARNNEEASAILRAALRTVVRDTVLARRARKQLYISRSAALCRAQTLIRDARAREFTGCPGARADAPRLASRNNSVSRKRRSDYARRREARVSVRTTRRFVRRGKKSSLSHDAEIVLSSRTPGVFSR